MGHDDTRHHECGDMLLYALLPCRVHVIPANEVIQMPEPQVQPLDSRVRGMTTPSAMHELHPESLTWTALLGKWIEFAQGSLALPADADGRRWRDSVPHIINLQAITFALGDIERLEPEDRPHARDRAEILIDQSESALRAIWSGEPVPEQIEEILDDARSALEGSVYAGLTELVWPGPGEVVMPAVAIDDLIARGGTLALAQPGTILMPGEPAAWWCDRSGDDLRALLPRFLESRSGRPRQVYRIFDADGAIERDEIASIDDEAPESAMPLLVPLLHQGELIGHFTLEARDWEQRQRAAMRGPVAVHGR